MMIERYGYEKVLRALGQQAAVGLVGPRQSGKTTLAHAVAAHRDALYLDLELPSDRQKLQAPEIFLREHCDKLVILDEIHRVPELFACLRGIIDEGRRTGYGVGRFLILGSAAIELLRQSSESLAGRISYISMHPFNLVELDVGSDTIQRCWLRGGFPDSYLADDDVGSMEWRRNFIRTYLERDIPQFGPRIPADRLLRLWTMLAHSQGALLNASRLASGLSVSSPTVTDYIDLLVDLMLVRRLQPYHANTKKRLIKSPKTYIRDSGIVHALLGIADTNQLAGHPVLGPSWEGYVIETLLSLLPHEAQVSFYRTSGGAEIDLLIDFGGAKGLWAIEIKHGLAPKPSRGMYSALNDVQPSRCFVVYSGEERYALSESVEAIGLRELAELCIK